MCALGACARLVGIDRFSDWPERVQALPRLGGMEDTPVERLLALRPDVVLAPASVRAVDRLEALGLAVVTLEPKTLADTGRVIAQVEMGPDKSIKDVLLRWIQRPMAWEVHMRAGSDTIEWVEENGREIRRRDSFKLSDLSRLREAVGPVAGLIPIPWPTPGTAAAGGNAAGPWVEWFAADEPMVAGRHKVRTFKVRARVLGQFDIVAHVSRAGEILRVSLPDQYLLASTALPGLESPSRK